MHLLSVAAPGDEYKLNPKPDFGYDDYEGSGKLKDKVKSLTVPVAAVMSGTGQLSLKRQPSQASQLSQAVLHRNPGSICCCKPDATCDAVHSFASTKGASHTSCQCLSQPG